MNSTRAGLWASLEDFLSPEDATEKFISTLGNQFNLSFNIFLTEYVITYDFT